MTDSKALIERLRVNVPYEAPRCLEAADHIAELEADKAQMRGALDDAFAQMVATFADPDRLKNSTLAMDAFCDAMERSRVALQETSHDA